MRVGIIDNGGQWTHLERKALKELGAEVRIIPVISEAKIGECDCLVLSGGRGSVNDIYAGVMPFIEEVSVPVLGICMGLHIMAKHFGGKVGKGSSGEFGRTEIFVDHGDELFRNIPGSFFVWESHNEEVIEKPEGLEVLAHSRICGVEALKGKGFYGVQFHPEVNETEYGREILRNFLEVTA